MGIIDGLLGNASEVDVEELDAEFAPVLADSEAIKLGYKVIRDLFIFTNKRLILVDKQGITGKRMLYQSIPYPSISHFDVETNGHFDIDAELRIWITGHRDPVVKDLKNKVNVIAIQKTLAEFMLG